MRSDEAEIDRLLATMSREQRVAQLCWLTVHGADVDEARSENLERFGVATPREVIEQFTPGGVVYFAWSGNTAHPVQTATLSAQLQEMAQRAGSGLPLALAVDEEGGRVARLGPPAVRWPSARALARAAGADATVPRWQGQAEELAAAGITVNLAPCVDTASEANPVLGARSFSTDPATVAAHGAAAVRGIQATGLAATVKHFPGHGACSADSHHELPKVDLTREEFAKGHLAPFAEVLSQAPPAAVMPGHLLVPAWDPAQPATLSKVLLTDVLRGELGFEGAVISDSLSMGALAGLDPAEVAINAVAAGVDVLLTPPSHGRVTRALVEAIGSGRLDADRVDDAVRRVLRLKQGTTGLAAGPARVRPPDRELQQALAADLARRAVVVEGAASALPVRGSLLVAGTTRRHGHELAACLRARGHDAVTLEVPHDTPAHHRDRTQDAGQAGEHIEAASSRSPSAAHEWVSAFDSTSIVVAGDHPDRVERALTDAADVIVDTGAGFPADGPRPAVRCYGDDPPALAAAADTLTYGPRARPRSEGLPQRTAPPLGKRPG